MWFWNRRFNLVMSGGGVKGIAYAGMFNSAERRGIRWLNIAGVSAGAIAGSLAGAGYNSWQMWQQLNKLDFDKMQLDRPENLPVVQEFREYARKYQVQDEDGARSFLDMRMNTRDTYNDLSGSDMDFRGNLLNNIITFSKNGCLFDGDLLEEWIYKALASRGVRTFADLRGGVVDSLNPGGYRVRVTGVDCNRGKVVLLPDDIEFYGIEPDSFEVAKAVRISTCVPFAFKPVVIVKKEGNKSKSYNLVDGGVFDRFPYWAIENKPGRTVGFKLSGGEKKKLFSIDTALDVLKAVISAVQDIGIPKNVPNTIEHIGMINAAKVHYLDFNLSQENKIYLYNAGRQTANMIFNKIR
jgi:NTE family protein